MKKILMFAVVAFALGTLAFAQEVHKHELSDDHSSHSSSSEAQSQSHSHSSEPIDPFGAVMTAMFTVLIFLGILMFVRSIDGRDLLEYSRLKRILKSKFYPGAIQVPTLFFFFLIIYYFFFGSSKYAQNPGSILAWTLWWPLVPITFVLLGRIWCLACPIPLVGVFLQKFVQPTRKPGVFLAKYGIWITDGIFLGITLFDRLYGMVESPLLSGAVFLTIIFGAISISLMYERRTFCKHLCFLGGVSGNYSMLSAMSIEAKDKKVCQGCSVKACYFGSGSVGGCPYSNVIPTKEGARNCNMCASCIKSCPNDNLALRVRSVASELWNHSKVTFSESFFAKLMVGVVIIQNLGMLAVWSDLSSRLMRFGFSEKGSIIALYLMAIAAPLLLMTLTSHVSNMFQTEKAGLAANFAAFGYAFIPIDVAGHLAHNIHHLLAEGKSVVSAFIGLFTGSVDSTGAFASQTTITGLQFALVFLGGFGTFFVAYKIAYAREKDAKRAVMVVLPHLMLSAFIFIVNIFLFTQPMGSRG